MKFDLRKALFVLPNLFTLSSIFCGFYAIMIAGGDPTAAQLKTAALLIAFALFFDAADGRVARLTRTQSDFGMELDSLADVISFGVAPALVAYRFGLQTLGAAGIFIAFAFAACGALRLARFNVLAHRNPAGSMKFFVGLPIPLAAGVLVSVILANAGQTLAKEHAMAWAILMGAVSLLMVSNVRYRTFKKIHSKRLAALSVLLVIASFAIAARVFTPEMAFAMLFACYLTLGLMESLFHTLVVSRRNRGHRPS